MRFFTMYCLFFLCINIALATPLALTEPLNTTPISFDIKKANQQFDHINIQLSVQNLNYKTLTTAVTTLSDLTEKADKCVAELQKKLNGLELLIKQSNNSVDMSVEKNIGGADQIYLETQLKELADQQAQCRLFSIRAKEAIEAYKTAIAHLKQEEVLTRGAPLWKTIDQTIESPLETNALDLISTLLPIKLMSVLSCLIGLSVALTCSIITLYKIKESPFARHYLRFRTIRPSYIVLLASVFISGSLFAYSLILYQERSINDLSFAPSGILFFYLSALTAVLFIFKTKTIRALFYWYSLDFHFFKSLTVTLLTYYVIAVLDQLVSSSLNTNHPIWQLCSSLFLLIILATGAYFIRTFCRTHRQFTFIQHHYSFIKHLSALLLISCAFINVLGYMTLARHLTYSGFSTFAIVFISILITQGIKNIYLMLNQQPSIKLKIIKYFGYRTDQLFTEFLILKVTLQLIVILSSIYLIGQSWSLATNFIDVVYDQILHGVHLANIMFYPSRIMSGIVVFCLLYLVCRAISTSISRYQQFDGEEETQVAVASILTYAGFSIALVSGFLVAGFNFTGLAIIAGALSVGIGLGLQSIVNNFVSGLILLIEKPIRPGDRINVDGLEGYVKKIRVRSTQITTPAREDIIVPNSDLITRPVTNYMFSDRFCRISCDIRMPYGSDTHLTREVLLNVANNNEEVVKTGRNKPTVLLRSFADSTLNFQLGCLIKDVNKKSLVQSELNFAIEQAFRDHDINMNINTALTQRDIHIRLADLPAFSRPVEDIVSA